jgi:ketosteroid isomerase-like protein
MSQENVELSKRVWELFVVGDTAGVLSLLDPEIEVREPPELPGARVFYGHAGWREQLDKFDEAFTNFAYEPLERIDCGEQVISVIHATGTGTSSGIPGEMTYAQLETWRAGKVVLLQYFGSKNQALEAVGQPQHDAH